MIMAINFHPDHVIPPLVCAYPLSDREDIALDECIQMALRKGWICLSTSPVAAPLFLCSKAKWEIKTLCGLP